MADAIGTSWKALVARFQTPCWWRAGWQLGSTLLAYAATWFVMWLALGVSWWLVLPLLPLASGLLVRIFIICHDCGHGSFFPSRQANDIVGAITGLLTFTPYRHWRAEHAVHHGATGDLDRRGVGDVWTMTVREYLAASRGRRFAYRFNRSPFVLFVAAPFVLFALLQRWPSRGMKGREVWSVWGTNLALVGMFAVGGAIFGWGTFAILQSLVISIAGAIGIWLFYMQHQFEHAYWQRGERWDYVTAALQGSSFLRLPKVLQWFSGNIGFHHIHHLSPRIPNYHLERCHASDPLFQSVQPMTLRSSWKSMHLRLWDERSQRLVGFRHLRRRRSSR
jgi:acyl-lipid omega-6 desaturase (Delta-12 desaturase)